MEYTLSQVLGIVKQSIDELMGEFQFWCVADVVSCQTKGKFTYLELAELDKDGNIIVKTKANIRDVGILTRFSKSTGLHPQDIKNQTILFSGHVSFHTTYGFSLVIDEISAQYSIGHLASSQQKIIDTLTKEGCINNNKLATLGLPPFSLAVISGHTSAGMEDFIAILDSAKVPYTLTHYPCAIQGNQAKQEVAEQLHLIQSAISRGEKYNIVCIMRGGGGVSDMMRQNDIEIARGICAMLVPVLVAIGHTQDTSVLEKVAWSHAKTPSDAAHFLVQEYTKYTTVINNLYDGIYNIVNEKITQYRIKIPHVYQMILDAGMQRISLLKHKIDAMYHAISLYDPIYILQQGYAIVRKNDTMLTPNTEKLLSVNDYINIETATFFMHVRIESIETKE